MSRNLLPFVPPKPLVSRISFPFFILCVSSQRSLITIHVLVIIRRASWITCHLDPNEPAEGPLHSTIGCAKILSCRYLVNDRTRYLRRQWYYIGTKVHSLHSVYAIAGATNGLNMLARATISCTFSAILQFPTTFPPAIQWLYCQSPGTAVGFIWKLYALGAFILYSHQSTVF